MSFLPSKYAPEGISMKDSSRTITIDRRPSQGQISKPTPVSPINTDTDIEMVSIDEDEEERTISQVLTEIRGTKVDSDEMEIDVFETAPPFTTVGITSSNLSYLIVDTNFMLAHLSVINKLMELAPDYQLRIIIPVAVMRELDGLKSSSRVLESTGGKSIGSLARWANNWIYSVLAKNNLYVRGQKQRQKLNSIHLNNDDSILDCCLYFHENNPTSIIVLLSNDKNLCAKALSNSVLTISYQNELTPELIASTILQESIQRFGENTDISSGASTNLRVPLSAMNSVIHSNKNNATLSIDIPETIANEVLILLKSVIKHCLEKEYGDELDLVRGLDMDSIETIHDCTMTMIRFWIPVFSGYFKRSNVLPFERQDNSKHNSYNNKVPTHTNTPNSKHEAIEFIEFWNDILTILYSQIMTEKQNEDLLLLHNRWQNLIS